MSNETTLTLTESECRNVAESLAPEYGSIVSTGEIVDRICNMHDDLFQGFDVIVSEETIDRIYELVRTARVSVTWADDKVHKLDAHGVTVQVWQDRHTGAPVVQVDTDEVPENEDGPRMRLNLNEHTYLDNAGLASTTCRQCEAGNIEHDLLVEG